MGYRLASHYLPGVSELHLPPHPTETSGAASALVAATGGGGAGGTKASSVTVSGSRSPISDEGRGSSGGGASISVHHHANQGIIDQDAVADFLFQPLSHGMKIMCILSRQSKFKVWR